MPLGDSTGVYVPTPVYTGVSSFTCSTVGDPKLECTPLSIQELPTNYPPVTFAGTLTKQCLRLVYAPPAYAWENGTREEQAVLFARVTPTGNPE